MNLLFLYGTLQPHLAPPEVAHLAATLKLVGEGRVRGHLFDCGEYPGAVFDATSPRFVCGRVYQLPDESLLALLDDYEGYDPRDETGSLFRRIRVPVETNAGEMNVWMYVWNRSAQGLKLIEDGMWRA